MRALGCLVTAFPSPDNRKSAGGVECGNAIQEVNIDKKIE
jgi:hypothetical protein